MDEQRLKTLDPTLFFNGDGWFGDKKAFVDGVLEKFTSFYCFEQRANVDAYDLDRIGSGIFYLRSLLERKRLTGKALTAVEVGCGIGNKSFAIHDLFGHYVGVDIDEENIATAIKRSKTYGVANIDFIHANAADVILKKSAYALPHKIDVLILYAVLEHLTLNERREILSAAEAVIADGGSVLVMESPNRLIPVDSHTSRINYLNNLPDELANDYWRARGDRPEASSTLLPSSDRGSIEILYRLGRGVSFHDFEIAMVGGLQAYDILADSYEAEMLNMEPTSYQEFSLLGDLCANIPDVPALAFSRCWVELLIGKSPHPLLKRKFISPFYPNWIHLSEPSPFFGSVSKAITPRTPWEATIDLGLVSDITLIFNAELAVGRFHVFVDDVLIGCVDCAELEAARPPRWHRGYAVAYKINQTVSKIKLQSVGAEASIMFQGCVISYA